MRWSTTHGDPTGRYRHGRHRHDRCRRDRDWHGRTGHDTGAAALEFALVLPVLLIVVFGLIDFGRMLNAQLIASDAAREGARAAAIVDAHEGETRIDSITASTIGGVNRTVTGCPSDPAPTDFAEATVVVVFHWATPLGAILDSANVTLTGHSEMQCQR